MLEEKITIVYESRTGNVSRFIDKIKKLRPDWEFVRIHESMDFQLRKRCHLITYTTKFGQVPILTTAFADINQTNLLTVSSSGNRNWGQNFALAADVLAKEFKTSINSKFELSGTPTDVENFINNVEKYYF